MLCYSGGLDSPSSMLADKEENTCILILRKITSLSAGEKCSIARTIKKETVHAFFWRGYCLGSSLQNNYRSKGIIQYKPFVVKELEADCIHALIRVKPTGNRGLNSFFAIHSSIIKSCCSSNCSEPKLQVTVHCLSQ